jgi:predicted nucleic acid-binding protein
MAAQSVIERAAAASGGWAIPWPCVHEFIAVVTGPAFGKQRTPLPVSFDAVRNWSMHPRCRLLGEAAHHLETVEALAARAGISGGAIHDARIAAICLGHGVAELWTSDPDFNRFPDLRVRNPLIPSLNEPLAPYRVAEAVRPARKSASPPAVPGRARRGR